MGPKTASKQIRAFNRRLDATPLGYAFEYALEPFWRHLLKKRSCSNPILDFLVHSRSVDELGRQLNTKSEKNQQLEEISINYNFSTVLKEDLRILSESTKTQLSSTVSQTVQTPFFIKNSVQNVTS